MIRIISAPIYALGLLVGISLFLELGRRLGLRRKRIDPEGARQPGHGVVDGAVFSLFGLLIAFTFSGAASRFDVRRQQIAEEANCIGTAYLRLDLLPAKAQPHLRELFRNYLKARLETYRDVSNPAAVTAAIATYTDLQGQIWAQSLVASQAPGANPDAARLLLTALNAMIDITTTRMMTARIHPPLIIYSLLFVLGLCAAMLAGYDMASGQGRSWLHMAGFVLVIVMAVYVIADIEYPRRGLIREDAYDQVLVDLLAGMK